MFEVGSVLVGIFLAQASPGPNMMAVSSVSLGSGRRLGIITAAGIATGVFLWALLATLGIGALLNAFPQMITAMRLIGGGYLLYLGLRALRTAFMSSGQGSSVHHVEAGAAAAYRRGFFVAITNPKAALVWAAISMYLASSGLSPLHLLFIDVSASISALLIYGAYALIFSTGLVMRVYARFFRAIEGGFGAIFGAIGAKLFIDGVRELKA
jgi:threonine/homoserine/homoserine lactone efflux protein